MNIDKFTEKAQAAFSAAQDIAVKMNHQQVDGEHIHLALATQEDGLIPKLISYMGQDIQLYYKDIETELEKLPKVSGYENANMYATRRFNEILIHAEEEAKRFKDEYTSVEHIYMALLKEKNTPSQTIFRRFGITVRKFYDRS